MVRDGRLYLGHLRVETAEIAHLKLRLTGDRSSIVANLTSTAGTPSLQGAIPA